MKPRDVRQFTGMLSCGCEIHESFSTLTGDLGFKLVAEHCRFPDRHRKLQEAIDILRGLTTETGYVRERYLKMAKAFLEANLQLS